MYEFFVGSPFTVFTIRGLRRDAVFAILPGLLRPAIQAGAILTPWYVLPHTTCTDRCRMSKLNSALKSMLVLAGLKGNIYDLSSDILL